MKLNTSIHIIYSTWLHVVLHSLLLRNILEYTKRDPVKGQQLQTKWDKTKSTIINLLCTFKLNKLSLSLSLSLSLYVYIYIYIYHYMYLSLSHSWLYRKINQLIILNGWDCITSLNGIDIVVDSYNTITTVSNSMYMYIHTIFNTFVVVMLYNRYQWFHLSSVLESIWVIVH